MNQSSASRFYFAFGHAECQRLLKREVELRYPELRLAFSRPGLVTFKQTGPRSEFLPRLALVSGESLGKLEDAAALVRGLEEREVGPVVARAWRAFDDEAGGGDVGSVPEFVEEALASRAPLDASKASAYLDVIHLDGASVPWLGLSVDSVGTRRLTAPIAAPEEPPSRAYAKLEEVLAATGLRLERGQRVLELGAAPGGATTALLRRGIEVTAVDPGELDPRVVEGPYAAQLSVITKPAGQLVLGDLGKGRFDWLVSDMNLAPPVAATQIAHAWSLVKRTARGAILTIKMNDERALGALSDIERRLASLMGGAPRILHLPSHRREVALVIERIGSAGGR